MLVMGLSILTPIPSQACLFYKPLTLEQYEVASVVFEGEVIAIHPESKMISGFGKTNNTKKERIVGLNITFNVTKVVRGNIPLGEIRVGWNRGGAHPIYPKTLAEFKDNWGKGKLRVGLTTPELFAETCNKEIVPNHKNYKTNQTDEREQLICEKSASGFYGKEAATKPYIYSAGCFDDPYMVPVDSNADGLNKWSYNNLKHVVASKSNNLKYRFLNWFHSF